MAVDHLFAYGTLKRGLANHALLAGAEFIAPARTEPKFRLIDCGPYPALIEHADAPTAILGELYRIDTTLLPALDELEDEGRLYRRIVIPVALLTDRSLSDTSLDDSSQPPIDASAYLWLGRSDRYPLVPGDRWPVP